MEARTTEKARSWIGVNIFALGVRVVSGVNTSDYRVGLIFSFFGVLLVATGRYVLMSEGKR